MIDRTAQKYWEVASIWRKRLDLTGIQNVQQALVAVGVLITIETDAMYRSTRPLQLARLYELRSEMIIGHKERRSQ